MTKLPDEFQTDYEADPERYSWHQLLAFLEQFVDQPYEAERLDGSEEPIARVQVDEDAEAVKKWCYRVGFPVSLAEADDTIEVHQLQQELERAFSVGWDRSSAE